MSQQNLQFKIGGMSCSFCAQSINTAFDRMEGVQAVNLSLAHEEVLMIVLSGVLVHRPKGKIACSITGGEGCDVAGRFTRAMFWISAGVFSVGAFFAYAIVPILRFIEG